MESQEFTSKVTIKRMTDDDEDVFYKIIVENSDSKASVILTREDLHIVSFEITAALTGYRIKNKGKTNA